MANSVIEATYVAVKTQFSGLDVRYPYSFDSAAVPYLYMSEVNDERDKPFLCDSKGGESRITIGYVSDDFADCVDTLESVIDWITLNLEGTYAPIQLWNVQPSSIRDLTGLEQAETKIYRREIDFLISWRKG